MPILAKLILFFIVINRNRDLKCISTFSRNDKILKMSWNFLIFKHMKSSTFLLVFGSWFKNEIPNKCCPLTVKKYQKYSHNYV